MGHWSHPVSPSTLPPPHARGMVDIFIPHHPLCGLRFNRIMLFHPTARDSNPTTARRQRRRAMEYGMIQQWDVQDSNPHLGLTPPFAALFPQANVPVAEIGCTSRSSRYSAGTVLVILLHPTRTTGRFRIRYQMCTSGGPGTSRLALVMRCDRSRLSASHRPNGT